MTLRRPILFRHYLSVAARLRQNQPQATTDNLIRDLTALSPIRGLIQELRLIPEDGVLQFELRGELAGILALCEAKNSKARRENATGLAEQIKLVAGAGFEPACASAYASAFGLKSLHWSDFRAPSAFKL